MEPAPLPPHERSWRHPSEIGPTRLDIEADGRGRPIFLAAGTISAVVLVAMLVTMTVAMTPRSAGGPNAISATTRPADVTQTTALPPASDGPQIIAANRGPRLASFAPIPNAIAAAPVAKENAVVVADTAPADRDVVHVTTQLVTYRVEWADLAFLDLGERALVFNDDGELVARIVDGRFEVLVD